MILINSNTDDVSTAEVIKWLIRMKKPFMLLLSNEQMVEVSYDSHGKSIAQLSDGRKLDLSKVQSYWYRRGRARFALEAPAPSSRLPYLEARTKEFIEAEANSFGLFMDYYLGKGKHISQLHSSQKVNKLKLADIAVQAGMLVPATLVTNQKQALHNFIERYGSAITKPIETIISYVTAKHWLPQYTTTITPEILEQLPDQFQLSLFQQKIKKKYELRVFCLEEELYAMAIFSQRDQQTAVDFRNYNISTPNRNIPFQLPQSFAQKVKDFLRLSDYRCGSLDILVDRKDNYYFLEINPVGQFGMVSKPCNYQLEKKIAQYL